MIAWTISWSIDWKIAWTGEKITWTGEKITWTGNRLRGTGTAQKGLAWTGTAQGELADCTSEIGTDRHRIRKLKKSYTKLCAH